MCGLRYRFRDSEAPSGFSVFRQADPNSTENLPKAEYLALTQPPMEAVKSKTTVPNLTPDGTMRETSITLR